MDYIKVAQATELTNGGKKKIIIDNKEILLINVDGDYYAIDDTCTHMSASLNDSNLYGDTITCHRHGAAFNVKTGKLVGRGKLSEKSKVKDIRTYQVKVDGNDISIRLDK